MATVAHRLLGISGSLRSQSTNTAVLKSLCARLGDQAEMSLFALNDIPLYNADIETEALPASVAALKEAIAQADGLIICSPEYNYGTSGVLKNALDWASRPGFNSPLKNKPVLIMTSSPGVLGGVRAQAQLRETLSATLVQGHLRPSDRHSRRKSKDPERPLRRRNNDRVHAGGCRSFDR